ncbi:MAG: T9SS type A sorting domain-containing protein, partial [Ignavibacteriales bacterium]|nr:T9SS type A sorting domain-containing protein [Ignavibacteriales bacterium]
NNLKQKGSRWCLYSGDANQDGIVDFGDLTLIDNDSYNFMSGYLVTDVNGDQYVDFGDLTICDNNSYNFVQVMKPGGAFKQPATRGILKTKMLPHSFLVSDNYPNPFNPSTKIDYALPKDAKVNIILYSILGEKVMEVVNAEQRAGYHTAHISINQFASGTYLVRFIAGDNVQTKKIVLAK